MTYSEKDHPHRAGRFGWITFLVTGPEAKLMEWQWAAMGVVEFFDRRAQTCRCRAHGDEEDRGVAAYQRAVELAKQFDVTVQDLVDTGRRVKAGKIDLGGGAKVEVSDCVEEYPVVHLGTHGMKWPEYLPK